MPGFDYHRPESLEDAFRLKSELPGARFIAGGTDVMVRIREGRLRPPALISLSRVRELAGIRHGDEIRIGAMTRVAELLRDEELGRSAPVLALAARTLGGMQVRNLATVGGNLCNASPCADTAPPLLVLDARVVVRSPGSERELPLADFFVAPGETRIGEGEMVWESASAGPTRGRARPSSRRAASGWTSPLRAWRRVSTWTEGAALSRGWLRARRRRARCGCRARRRCSRATTSRPSCSTSSAR